MGDYGKSSRYARGRSHARITRAFFPPRHSFAVGVSAPPPLPFRRRDDEDSRSSTAPSALSTSGSHSISHPALASSSMNPSHSRENASRRFSFVAARAPSGKRSSVSTARAAAAVTAARGNDVHQTHRPRVVRGE